MIFNLFPSTQLHVEREIKSRALISQVFTRYYTLAPVRVELIENGRTIIEEL